ncbi:MAG: LuxR family transcriptional regulator [Proteobacteria bacterium]|nr:MAG: LuxR family transcriptional regulator [Pseudomonadota bacterium]
MAAFMKPFEPQLFALLRIVAGLMFLCHGTQKLFGWPAPVPDPSAVPAFVTYVGGPVELITGLLVAVGLFTRWAAFIAAGQMAAAYWIAHGLNSFFPLVNQGELAVLYCFVFLFIAAHGSGIWSADAARAKS